MAVIPRNMDRNLSNVTIVAADLSLSGRFVSTVGTNRSSQVIHRLLWVQRGRLSANTAGSGIGWKADIGMHISFCWTGRIRAPLVCCSQRPMRK